MKSLALLTINHEGHKIFWKSINADLSKFKFYSNLILRHFGAFLVDRNYDVYITEDLVPLKYLRYNPLFKKKILLDVVADGLPYVYLNRPEWYYLGTGTHSIKLPKVIINKHLNDVIKSLDVLDGAFAVSNLVKRDLSKVYSGPIKVVRPSISEEKAKVINKYVADPTKTNIVTVGTGSWKGIDLLINAFEYIVNEKQNVTLYIKVTNRDNTIFNKINKLNPRIRNKIKLISKHLSIEKYFAFLSSCSIYVQASYYDPHPVSVSEAMGVGLIPIVTNEVGSKELFENEYPFLVSKVNSESLAKRILKIIDSKDSKKIKISKKMKDLYKQVLPNKVSVKFRESLYSLIGSI